MGSPTLTTGGPHTSGGFYPAPQWSFPQLLGILGRTVPVPASTLPISQALPGLGTLRCSCSSPASSRDDKHRKLAVPDPSQP